MSHSSFAPRYLRLKPSRASQLYAIQHLIRPAEVVDLLRVAPHGLAPSIGSFAELVSHWLREQFATGGLRYLADPNDSFDYWCSPGLTRERQGGDCEDLSILSVSLLHAGGVGAHVVVGTYWHGPHPGGGHAWVEGADRFGWFLLEATSGHLFRWARPSAYRSEWALAPGVCHSAA